MKITTILTSIILSVFSLYAFSAEYQFRQNLEGTSFTSETSPAEPEKPEFDISPWQGIVTGFMVPVNTSLVVKAVKNCPYRPGLPDCIISKNNDVEDIMIKPVGTSYFTMNLSTQVKELKDNLVSITVATAKGKLTCSNIELVDVYANGTFISCYFDQEFDFAGYATGERVNAIVSLNK
ncbi:hypothetical protein [Pseudomonas sp. MF6747]|uniref:hypothetical protein n=1 Tax=Pseudomonas sp. MF6747 TaxID=2797527 RepID=UPI0019096D50|nr:hypothetical protein [Pseudomonas sp. MF6747]MBK3506620.1 hypothetical protein [Pseudomonas sp. MF6747]